ncbi:MAG: ion transporter, partial [Aureliella sp.]
MSSEGQSEPRGDAVSQESRLPAKERLVRERQGLLRTVSSVLDTPMTILSFVWLVLLIVDFTVGLNSSLENVNQALWGLFVLHFALEFWIAPKKVKYLKKNWLTAVALVLPAFRILRAFRGLRFLRAARVGRSMRLLRWVTSMNRGMKATRRTLRQRGMSYVLALTVLVCFAGAAGVYAFENPAALQRDGVISPSNPTGIGNYGEAVWWTAMMLTSMGSDYFPKTTEGRIIAWLLAVYAFAIFGYITATVASLIIKVDQGKNLAAATQTATGQSAAQPTSQSQQTSQSQPASQDVARAAAAAPLARAQLAELQQAVERIENQLQQVLARR